MSEQKVLVAVQLVSLRNQTTARRIVKEAYPFACCAVCGLQVATCLHIAHLDHNAGNNSVENLARLCPTHHWMFDAGLYPIEAIRLMQTHWQKTRGEPDHSARMKDAGARAAGTRKRSATARKAVATRRANAAKDVETPSGPKCVASLTTEGIGDTAGN